MIKADPGHVAVYTPAEDGGRRFSKEVAAWDDDGHPMVVNHEGLVRAESIPGYKEITQVGDPTPFAFIPGNGWMVERPNGSRDPLVAWAMCTYGGGSGVFALPVFTTEMHSFMEGGATWTSTMMGGDSDPVRVVPEKPSDRA